MKLIYIGPHLAVEVPLDGPLGGFVDAKKGEVVDLPDDTAAGLLEQGKSACGHHDPQWKKATGRAAAAAEKDGDA